MLTWFFRVVKFVVKVVFVALVVIGLAVAGYKIYGVAKAALTPATAPSAEVLPAPAPAVVEPKAAEPTQAPEPTKVPTASPSDCRHEEWLQNAISGTTDVSGLLAVIDRDFQITEGGGQWSDAGFTVPANAIFWTDLLTHEIPSYVVRIRTQGNWGVYKTSGDFVVPSPNGGGRWMAICK